jgi:CMP-2-keto-3-deoxyoctulosonic acid synthetase
MYKHFGLCIFNKSLLKAYNTFEDGYLQLCEDNEWLKLLENNYNIVSKLS